MAFVADLIDRATENTEAAWHFISNQIADVERLFGSEQELVLSLQHRWATMLTAKLDQADYDGVSADDAVADLRASQPGLRALLDGGARDSVRLRALKRAEHRLVEVFGGDAAAYSAAVPAGA
jgi:hypothetical protein